MKKFALLFMVFFVFVMVGMVSAFDESSVDIDITFLYNLEDDIFVGNSNTPIGEGSATVPLTVEGVPIIDPEVDPQNAGIHILRGVDEFGQFIEISVPGPVMPELRLIKFDIEFDNAVIVSFVNGSNTGEYPYENPLEDGCGINEEDPEETESFNDEYFIDIGGTQADFCSATNNGKDIVRIYIDYLDMTAPIITDIVTVPPFNIEIEEEEELTISVDFNSSEFPIEVSFELFDDNDLVHSQEGVLVINAGDLPVEYFVPLLDEGVYSLKMIVEDSDGNNVVIVLGDIIVSEGDDGDDDDDDDGEDDDNNGGSHGDRRFVFESIKPVIQSRAIVLMPLQDTIVLDEPKLERRQGSLLFLWIIILLILIAVLVILILMTANR